MSGTCEGAREAGGGCRTDGYEDALHALHRLFSQLLAIAAEFGMLKLWQVAPPKTLSRAGQVSRWAEDAPQPQFSLHAPIAVAHT